MISPKEERRLELTTELDELVDDGVLVKVLNRDGLPMWGFPVDHPDHDWGNPKVDEWVVTDEGPIVTLRWYCTRPGCSERRFTPYVEAPHYGE